MKGKIALIQILLFCVLTICIYLVVDTSFKKKEETAGFEDIKKDLEMVTPAPESQDTVQTA